MTESFPNSVEAPEADAVEQALPAAPDEPEDDVFDLPLEADPADAVDQRRRAGSHDEDDYR
jgi:hypothetical protein